MPYIYQQPGWPRFTWDTQALVRLLSEVRHEQGRLFGQMQTWGFPLREEASLTALTEDVVKSSEIEGERLDREQVRSSLARRMGLPQGGLRPADREVEGIVEIMLDATRNFDKPLTQARLFAWHAALFPTGRDGMRKMTVGRWRRESDGPMQVVSGPVGRERIHYEAPAAKAVSREMERFLRWFAAEQNTEPVLMAGLAHLWFVAVHPFADGNGRIARAVADMCLARADGSAQRFYSMSTQIRRERRAYYRILEATTKGGLDVTGWLAWFLECLSRAIADSDSLIESVRDKARFWQDLHRVPLNERQRRVLNRLLEGFEGKLTSTKWAKLTKSSQDTAQRDLAELVEIGILAKSAAGGRSTSYSLAPRRKRGL